MGCGAISGTGLNQAAVFSRSGFLIKLLPILAPSKWKETSALSTHVSSTPDNKVDTGIPICGLFYYTFLGDFASGQLNSMAHHRV